MRTPSGLLLWTFGNAVQNVMEDRRYYDSMYIRFCYINDGRIRCMKLSGHTAIESVAEGNGVCPREGH